MHPDHSRTKPYKFADIFKAGKYVFDVNAFHNSPPEGLETPSQLQSKSQGGLSESQVVTRIITFPTPPTAPPVPDSFDGLVQCLRNLQVNDPEYANTYARLVSFVPKPAVNNTVQTNNRAPCLFCKDSANIHLTRNCPVAQEYLKQSKISFVDSFWRWPSGARIRSDPQGFKHVVDSAQPPTSAALFFEVLPTTQTPTAMAASFIEEVQEDSAVQDAYKAYQLALAASKEKKSPGVVSTPTPTPVSGVASTSSMPVDKKVPQFQYKSKVEDSAMAQKVFDRIMEAPVMLTQGELLALAPEIRKLFVDGCKVNRIPVYAAASALAKKPTAATVLLTKGVPSYTSPIMELDIKIQGKHSEVGLYDCGSELVCISKVAAKEMGLPFSSDMQLHMRDANGGSRATFGIIENLQLDIGGVAVYVHAWIIKNAPYRVLLGRPFQIAAQADTEDVGETLVLQDPSRPGFKLRVPMRPHKNPPHSPPSCNVLLSQFATLTATSLSMLATTQTPNIITPLVASSIESGRVSDSLPTTTLLSVNLPFAGRYFRET